MKIMGNIIYVKVDKELYRKEVNNAKFDLLKMVTKIMDAQIQSSEIDYISIMNVSNEWSFMKKLKSVSRVVFWNKQIGYLFEW